MISAPLRTSETLKSKPSIKTQGHLALLEWEDTPPAAKPRTRPLGRTAHRSLISRCYDGGVLVLMAVTLAAMAASLARF